MRARLGLALRVLRGTVPDTPAMMTVMRSIEQALGGDTSAVTSKEAVAGLVRLDKEAMYKPESGIPAPWMKRVILEMAVLGYPNIKTTLASMVAIWRRWSTGELDVAGFAEAWKPFMATLPKPSRQGPSVAAAEGPAFGSAVFDHGLDMPSHFNWRRRLDYLEVYLATARTVQMPEVGYAVGDGHVDRAPKPHHVGVCAQGHAALHPVPRSPSPVIWACKGNVVGKTILMQTQQVMHPGITTTTYTCCPLCGKSDAETILDLQMHLVVHCPETADLRNTTVTKIAEWMGEPSPPSSDEEVAGAVPVLPVPSAILDCVQAVVGGQAFDQAVLHRLLLCGQWVKGARGCGGLTLAEAGVLTHPHLETLRVYVSDTGNGSKVMRPPTCWKRVVEACGMYCADVFDLLVEQLKTGRGVARAQVADFRRRLPHMVSTV